MSTLIGMIEQETHRIHVGSAVCPAFTGSGGAALTFTGIRRAVASGDCTMCPVCGG